MVKFKIIARNLTTWGDAPSHWGPGWAKIPGEYDTVGKAVDACREQQEPYQSHGNSRSSLSNSIVFFSRQGIHHGWLS